MIGLMGFNNIYILLIGLSQGVVTTSSNLRAL